MILIGVGFLMLSSSANRDASRGRIPCKREYQTDLQQFP